MKIKPLLGIFAAGFLVGCASVGHPIDQDKLSQVIRGKSTYPDVVALMGEPQHVQEVDGPSGKRTELHYLYSYTAADGKNFIPYYGSFASEFHTKSQDVVITINGRGVVESITKNFGSLNTKSGTVTETPIERKPAPQSKAPTVTSRATAPAQVTAQPSQQSKRYPRPIGMIAGRRGACWFYFAGVSHPVFVWVSPAWVA